MKNGLKKWVNQIQGKVPDQTETPTTDDNRQIVNPYSLERYNAVFGIPGLNYGGKKWLGQ